MGNYPQVVQSLCRTAKNRLGSGILIGILLFLAAGVQSVDATVTTVYDGSNTINDRCQLKQGSGTRVSCGFYFEPGADYLDVNSFQIQVSADTATYANHTTDAFRVSIWSATGSTLSDIGTKLYSGPWTGIDFTVFPNVGGTYVGTTTIPAPVPFDFESGEKYIVTIDWDGTATDGQTGVDIRSGAGCVSGRCGRYFDSDYDSPGSYNYFPFGSPTGAQFNIVFAYDTDLPDPTDPLQGTTHIISFEPENGTTTASTTVNFSLSYEINPDDVAWYQGYRILFYYQEQPYGVPNYLLDTAATTTGVSTFNFTETLETGNYILNAVLTRTYAGGVFENPFSDGGLSNSPTSLAQYHQFKVVQGTLSGDLFQGGIGDIQDQIDNLSTSTEAVFAACNPIGNFDIALCLYGIFIPNSAQFNQILSTLYNDFAIRVPFGYATLTGRALLGYNSVATSTLSSSNLSLTLPSTGVYAGTSTSQLAGETITFINWETFASSTRNLAGSSAMIALNNFLAVVFGAGFLFWVWRFANKHMKP